MFIPTSIAKDIEEGYIALTVDEMCDEMGSDTINVPILWTNMLFTRDHRVIQRILATGFNDFHRGPAARLKTQVLFGTGIFGADGQEWKQHCSLTKPFFGRWPHSMRLAPYNDAFGPIAAREQIRDFNLFGHYTNKVLDVFCTFAAANKAIDVQDVFARFTLDAGGQFLFGTKELHTLDGRLPRAGRAKLGIKGSAPEGSYGGFMRAFDDVQTIASTQFQHLIFYSRF